MTSEQTATTPTGNFYDGRSAPYVYDLAVHAIFLPFGGVQRLRKRALDLLSIQPGTRVLELGCGTGGITRLLLARGAKVTAVDGSQQMLDRAQRRAPAASFHQARLEAVHVDGKFDLALFAFVLHELTPEDRLRALVSAREALAAGGKLAILDHAVPTSPGLAKWWRSFLMRIEPPTVVDCITDAYQRDLAQADLLVLAHHPLARGTAKLIVAQPAAAGTHHHQPGNE
jgi:ubiquinone/menaquinone biosynthesis C-methylase UbiE